MNREAKYQKVISQLGVILEDRKGKTEKVNQTEDDVRGNEIFESTVNCIQEVDEGRWVRYE